MQIERTFGIPSCKCEIRESVHSEDLNFVKSLVYWAAERGILPDPNISMRHLNEVDSLEYGYDKLTRCFAVEFRIKSLSYQVLIKIMAAISKTSPEDIQGRIRVYVAQNGGDSNWFALMNVRRWGNLIIPEYGSVIFDREKAVTDLYIGPNELNGYAKDQLDFKAKYPGIHLDFEKLELVLKALVSEELMGLSPLSIEQRLTDLLS